MPDFIGLLSLIGGSSARLEPTSAFLGAAGMADLTAEESSMASSGTSQRVIAPLRLVAEQAFSRTAGVPLVQENRIRILKNGQENYPAWLDAIGAPRKRVHFESYIIHADDIGYRFADLLCTKARKGVRVRVIYDWFGARGASSWTFWRRWWRISRCVLRPHCDPISRGSPSLVVRPTSQRQVHRRPSSVRSI